MGWIVGGQFLAGVRDYLLHSLLTDYEGLQGCEILRIPHWLDSWLTDGAEVVSPTHRPRSTPQKHFSASGTHFF
jgi:hypothetical protein